MVNKLTALIAFILVAWIAFLYLASPAKPLQQLIGVQTPLEARSQAFAQVHLQDLISYADSVHGFKLFYPIGYEAVLDPEVGVRVRFRANYPLSSSEVIDLSALNFSAGSEEFELLSKQFKPEEVQLKRQETINGRKRFLVYAKTVNELTGEIFLVRQALYQCFTPQGKEYSLLLTAVVPEALQLDTDLVDYMIASLAC